MVVLDDDFIASVKVNYPKSANKIIEAYEFAASAHENIKRKSGEPYIVHPLSVAKILIDNDMDYSTIMAGFLHDVVEDTNFTIQDIKKKFGSTVAKLVDGVTKINSIDYSDIAKTEAETKLATEQAKQINRTCDYCGASVPDGEDMCPACGSRYFKEK